MRRNPQQSSSCCFCPQDHRVTGNSRFWAILGCSGQPGCRRTRRGMGDCQNPEREDLQIQPAHSFAAQLAAGVVLACRESFGRVFQSESACESLCPRDRSRRPEKDPLVDSRKNVIMAWFIHLPACALIASSGLLVRQPGPWSGHGKSGKYHGRARDIEATDRPPTAERPRAEEDKRPPTADRRQQTLPTGRPDE